MPSRMPSVCLVVCLLLSVALWYAMRLQLLLAHGDCVAQINSSFSACVVQAVDELTLKWEEAWYLREQEVQDERELQSEQLRQQQHQASTPLCLASTPSSWMCPPLAVSLCVGFALPACLLNIISFQLRQPSFWYSQTDTE